MKTLAIIGFFIVFLTASIFAQSKEDVVYLHNGSVLRGKVIENVNGKQATIELVGRNILLIPDSLIEVILMDQVIPSKERENKAMPVEMAAAVNFYGGSKNTAGFTFTTSYRFPFRLAVGGGMGIEWFGHQQIPFIANVQYSFLKGSWSPYVFALSGYAVPLSKKMEGDYSDYYGGILVGAGGGLRFDFTNHNALVFSAGYRYQKTKTVTTSYPWYSSYSQYQDILYNEFNRLTFSFGFLFN